MKSESPKDPPQPPVEPRRPEESECCGRGCRHCVFDVYEQALERYQRALQAWKKRAEVR
jgi:hypothetical protein